eukprot:CAMPEP_0113657648 /NCGR_PEP_ID=MMETSP0017_2-20120614/31190_1 /TAXON_ID=2856 /ORGANISM="Cylindrotheca closterium" /LENGTH=47 /DNA_ID=CAMNT_0000571653 /DNA_START=494 /DNA_END=637 /DNA_ORIENTATION=+ /assembly_acc=CAM_ASM_000147
MNIGETANGSVEDTVQHEMSLLFDKFSQEKQDQYLDVLKELKKGSYN